MIIAIMLFIRFRDFGTSFSAMVEPPIKLEPSSSQNSDNPLLKRI